MSQPATKPKQAENAASPHPAPRFVGLDVHKRQITWCIIDRDGKTLKTGELPLTAGMLDAFVEATLLPTDRVVLESTTNCWAVVDIIQRCVPGVVVSNPMATKAIAASKIKTDKVDAHVLAQLLRCDFIPAVWQPDASTRLRRQLSGRRASLVGQRVQLQNRIHSVLAMRLIVPPGDVALFSKAGQAWLEALDETSIDSDGLVMIRSDLRLLESLQHEIDVFDQRLTELAYQMLKDNEPYRYSPPRSTETKLAGLRVKATGQRRKGGSGKGVKSQAKLPGGSKTIKPLDVVYHQEGLPLRQTLAAGEQKMLAATECQDFVRTIGQQQIIPRRKQKLDQPDNPPTTTKTRKSSGQQANDKQITK